MEAPSDRIRKRVWVQNVAVQADVLETKLNAIRARKPFSPEQEELAQGTLRLITRAREAAFRDNPIPSRWAMWWRGTLVDAAYQNLHAAEALITTLYDKREVKAEIPDAVARVEASVDRNDPRRESALELLVGIDQVDPALARERLRKAIEVGYGHADQLHLRLRSFRNLVLTATVAIALFMTAFVVVVWRYPAWVPLCFKPAGLQQVCPTGIGSPSGSDVLIIGLLGLLGGSLAGAVSISRLKGTSTPYDVPTALAVLKAPFGAMTAIGSIIIIRGGFVPGLSALDSQVQILAYAMLFGYAQQLLTGLIDRQAQHILEELPSMGTASARPELRNLPAPVPVAPAAPAAPPGAAAAPPAAVVATDVAAAPPEPSAKPRSRRRPQPPAVTPAAT